MMNGKQSQSSAAIVFLLLIRRASSKATGRKPVNYRKPWMRVMLEPYWEAVQPSISSDPIHSSRALRRLVCQLRYKASDWRCLFRLKHRGYIIILGDR